MKEWVEAQVASGHYANACDYVRDLIRRDQAYRDEREALIRALVAGEQSGESKRTLEEIWRGAKGRHGLDV